MADFSTLVAGCGGATAWRWNQDTFLVNQTFGADGVCGPLALKWLKDSRHRINFVQDTATPEGRDEVMQLRVNQKESGNYTSNYLKLFGFHKHFTQNFPSPVSLNAFVPAFTAGPGYYFIGVSNMGLRRRVSGHALAVDMYTRRFFDPNFGEAYFPSTESLQQFFRQLFRLEYGALHGNAMVERYI